MKNSDLVELDLNTIWHPCSQMKDYIDGVIPFLPIKKGDGIYLEDYDGNRYLDAVSSWWVNILGHRNPYIVDAIKKQLDSLEHVIFAGYTHKPAIDLARRIVEIAPDGLKKVFFADNGSSAIEVAIKMAFHSFKNRGENRPVVVSLTNSYHGETLGALAVGDVALYKEIYSPLMIKTLQAKSPALFDEAEALDDMRLVLSSSHEICAVIVEPLVQCAGYMKMYKPSYLKSLRKLCDEAGVYLIADEIATGFGRTGTMFAFNQAAVSPDIMTLSKGITGGFLPLALAVTTDEIYRDFYCDYLEGKSFLHSHSYTANPLACAAANATLDLFADGELIRSNQQKSALFQEKLKAFEEIGCVANIRSTGMIHAFDLVGFDPRDRTGIKIYKEALKRGFMLRPLGDTVYFMTPYVITNDQIEALVETTKEIVLDLKH